MPAAGQDQVKVNYCACTPAVASVRAVGDHMPLHGLANMKAMCYPVVSPYGMIVNCPNISAANVRVMRNMRANFPAGLCIAATSICKTCLSSK